MKREKRCPQGVNGPTDVGNCPPVLGRLTSRDLEILDALTLRVRLLSVPQIARTWWELSASGLRAARGRLQRLETDGHLHRFILQAHPEIPLEEPLARWIPGESPPNFGPLSYKLKSRWTLPPVPVLAVVATVQAGRRFGIMGGRFPKPTERTHDLHLAALFLRKRAEDPFLVGRWRSESAISAQRSEAEPGDLPDVILDGDPPLAVEFGGSYRRDRLEAFHRFCETQRLRYEIW